MRTVTSEPAKKAAAIRAMIATPEQKKRKPLKVKGIDIPEELPEEVRPFYAALYKEFSEQGLSPSRYKRTIILLAKHLTMESRLEKAIEETGGYLSKKGTAMARANPGLAPLLTVRGAILNTLKSCGLVPKTGEKFLGGEQAQDSAFAALQ